MPSKVLTLREALKNPLRRRIVTYLLDNPGASIRQLSRSLGVSIGSLSGHLVILERVGLIREVRNSKRVELFINHEVLLHGITDEAQYSGEADGEVARQPREEGRERALQRREPL